MALQKDDFSEELLIRYQEKLEDSFVLKDLKSYRYLMDVAHDRRQSFFDYYFRKINEFFEMFVSVDSIPKRQKYWNFIKRFFTGRNVLELFKDIWGFMRLLWGMIR